jgi:tetraacyldisaccharide 4'-kinase
MREPTFWRDDNLLTRMLAPAAALYGAVADARMQRAGHRAGIPVLCVGNLTVGGAGKTPTAIALGKLLLERGEKPFFLTRGYGGASGGPVLVRPSHSAREVGDEPLLLAQIAPTIVAHDRIAGAAMAVKVGASMIVMDDGFQNPALAKDFSLLVIDGERGVGNGQVFPAGPLRASLQTQINRASAALFVGPIGASAQGVMVSAKARGLPVFTARLAPDASVAAKLSGRKVLAFAGIAHPKKFFATLEACGIAIGNVRSFADHHSFTARDAAELLDVAVRENLVLMTTEKDMARMRGDSALSQLAQATTVLPVTMSFDDDDAIRRDVIEKFSAVRAGY